MKKKIPLIFFILIFSQVSYLSARRIVSLAPGITEIIFELGSGHDLVGVTDFCDFPREAQFITKVGGLIDLNLERIVSLEPDLIFQYPEHMNKLEVLRGRTVLIQVPHRTLSDLYRSIKIISSALGKPENGTSLINRIRKSLSRISRQVPNPRKRVMIVAARSPGPLRNITIAGGGDFLNELIHIAGGVNCYTGSLYYPTVSLESVLSMNPDMIIEFSFFFKKDSDHSILDPWEKYPEINAVKRGSLFVIRDPYWLRPGPRVVLIAKKLNQLLFGKH